MLFRDLSQSSYFHSKFIQLIFLKKERRVKMFTRNQLRNIILILTEGLMEVMTDDVKDRNAGLIKLRKGLADLTRLALVLEGVENEEGTENNL